MRVIRSLIATALLLSNPVCLRAEEKLPPPGNPPVTVLINSQKSLVEIVGSGFQGDHAWAYPHELLPAEFPGLQVIKRPGDSGKRSWRQPVLLRDEVAKVDLAVNCYRRKTKSQPEPAASTTGATPFQPLTEPEYAYRAAKYRELPAAEVVEETGSVFAYRDGDLLIKIKASGGDAAARQTIAQRVADAIWNFQHPAE